MKKFFLMLAVALPMLMVSCGDDKDGDDKTLSLDQTAITLDYSQSTTIVPSEKKGEWASSNEYVATVDKDGKVVAKHVGNATITYSKDGMSASCTVKVKSTNDAFNTTTTWGASPAQVMANYPEGAWVTVTGDRTGDCVLAYQTDEAFPWYGFIYEENALAGSSIYFEEQMFDDSDFNGYLAQRFVKNTNPEESEEYDGVLYQNAETLSQATESVVVDYDTEYDVYVATFMPVEKTTKGAPAVNKEVVVKAKALYKAAVKK